MSKTVRCPNPKCNFGFGRLAFDSYYSCDDCHTYLGRDSFMRWLEDIRSRHAAGIKQVDEILVTL